MQIWVLIQWLTRWVSEWPIPRKHLSSLFSTRCPIFLKAAAPAAHNSRNRSSTNAGTSSTCLRRLPHGPPACRWSSWRRRWTRRPSGSSRPTCTSHRREETAVAEPQAERGRDDRSAAADHWIQVPWKQVTFTFQPNSSFSRESAAFLLRSADELEHLLQIQPKL